MCFKNEALRKPLKGAQTGKHSAKMLQVSLETANINLHAAVRELLHFGSPRHQFFHEESPLPL